MHRSHGSQGWAWRRVGVGLLQAQAHCASFAFNLAEGLKTEAAEGSSEWGRNT